MAGCWRVLGPWDRRARRAATAACPLAPLPPHHPLATHSPPTPSQHNPQAGIERQAASRNLFIKLLSLLESRQLLGAEAAGTVDLGKIFGVTQRDILTLRSGYSAEAEGAALNEEEEGDDGAAA